MRVCMLLPWQQVWMLQAWVSRVLLLTWGGCESCSGLQAVGCGPVGFLFSQRQSGCVLQTLNQIISLRQRRTPLFILLRAIGRLRD